MKPLARLVVSLLLLAACNEDQPPTGPASSTRAPGPAGAQSAVVRVVNSLADPGDGTCNAQQCTLREAINDPQSSEVRFASGLTGAITLAPPPQGGGLLVIERALSITAPSAGITVQRRSGDPRFRIFRIGTGGNVQLTNLTIRNGSAELGGGIVNFGSLALTHCTVADNAATSHGGGIDNHGPLTLVRTSVINNSAASGRGGGIDNHNGPLTITNSAISHNSGGGLNGTGGTLEITNTALNRNSNRGIALDWTHATLNHLRVVGNTGGGIFQHQSHTTIRNSLIAFNSASEGAGFLNSAGGSYVIQSSTISGNTASQRGGGIRNTSGDPFGRVSADVRLINSTVSGNSAPLGGGIENSDDRAGADVFVLNSTIARNSASVRGGGVHNTDPGPDADAGVSIFLLNSIVAQNTAPASPDAFEAAARFSLIGDGSGSGISQTNGNKVGTHASPLDPRIGALADNGGPTRTHALLAGSPAIDAASNADCPATDQRGVARPRGAGCDMGSYER